MSRSLKSLVRLSSAMRWIACGSALVAMAVPAMPQQSAADSQAPSTATIHVQSRLVVLDVVVTDKKGKPLTGLSKSDFTVLEDGKPQTLRHMDYTALAGDSKASGFKSVFVLDVLNSTLDESAYGKAQLAHYLSTQPETLPQPAMLVTVDDRGFKMIAAYTTDRKALQSALHAYKSGIPFDFTRGDNEARLTITFDALRQIALASIGSPGRTELIWLGHGFPAMNLMNIPPQDAATMQALVQNITNQLLEARIVLYKVDPAAVGAPAVTPNMDDADSAFDDTAQPFADSISFDSMIQQTGGHSFFNRNDVDAEFSKAVDLGGSFYTLSYSPTGESTAAAGYRHIRVLVNQPGAKAVTRQGYFKIDAAAAPEAPANPAAVVDGAIINNLVYSALGVHITSLTRAPSGTSTRCFMRLDAKDIHWTLQPDGSRVMNLLVGAATYGANGKPLTYSRDTATLHMDAAAPDSDSALHSDFEIPMHIPPAAASLRIVVLAEETGKLGSADATSIPADAHSLR